MTLPSLSQEAATKKSINRLATVCGVKGFIGMRGGHLNKKMWKKPLQDDRHRGHDFPSQGKHPVIHSAGLRWI